ncbi:MAG: DNA-formamidopyrimidine glycosylase family protein [Thermoanaerobaculia bacterium]
MPELPEVESYARYFERHALGRRIARVRVLDERILATRREVLVRTLRGRTFERVRRHGKHLFAAAGDRWLRLHFGMSGDLTAWDGHGPVPRFARVVFDFDDGSHLAFEDMRLFGVVELVKDPDLFVRERGLGPDPLDASFDLRAFRALLAGRRGAIKSLLMTQEAIAGIGNLYADEMLYQTGIHPRRSVDTLSPAEAAALFRAMKRVLRGAVKRRVAGRDDPARWLIDHREEDAPCPICGGTIRRTVVFGRTTYFCGKHQG